MKKRIALSLMFFLSPVLASDNQSKNLNTERQVGFAERVVIIEIARALSPSIRISKERCGEACSDSGALELAIGLLGIDQSNASAKALVDLLGARLDGAGSEELSCQMLVRGKDVEHHLKHLNSKQIAEHCRSFFGELKKREISDIKDVGVDQVCHTESEISRTQREFLKAITSGVFCEQ